MVAIIDITCITFDETLLDKCLLLDISYHVKNRYCLYYIHGF